MTSRPKFIDLPISRRLPPRSSWNVFGEDDEVGTLNLIDPRMVASAARLIQTGEVYPLNWDLESPSPALFGREVVRHRIIDLDPVGTEDVYDNFYPQASSQWDALSHIKHPEHGFYNGRRRQDITGRPGSRNGIDHWARRGIVGRYVLADMDRFRLANGSRIRQGESDPVTVDELDSCLAATGTPLGVGDILLIRFGWITWYEGADQDVRVQLASTDFFASPGLANEPRTAEWLWDHGVAAVAADNPAVEVQPFDESTEDGFLHYQLIPLLGMAIGELFALDSLAAACALDGRYDGLLTAAPLNKIGGSGSPANALAIR